LNLSQMKRLMKSCTALIMASNTSSALIQVKALLIAVALGFVLLALTAYVGSSEHSSGNSTNGKSGELSGPVGVLVANHMPTIPADQRCHFECLLRDADLRNMHDLLGPNCTLEDVVSTFGPPEKVLTIAYGTDYILYTGLELLYPSKGLTFAVSSHSKYPDLPPQPRRTTLSSYYYCYVPTTFDEYYDKAVNGNRTLITVEDWKGFKN
jgi:hypothetical protein